MRCSTDHRRALRGCPAWVLALLLGTAPLPALAALAEAAAAPAGSVSALELFVPAAGQGAPLRLAQAALPGAGDSDAPAPQVLPPSVPGEAATATATPPARPARGAAPRPPDRVTVRIGIHPGFGRVVFEWPELPGYTMVQTGDEVELIFGPAGTIAFEAAAVRLPRNVRGIEPLPGGMRFHLAEGARARHFVLGRRVVVDMLDPPPPPSQAPPPRAAASPPVSQPLFPQALPPAAGANALPPPAPGSLAAPRPGLIPPGTPVGRAGTTPPPAPTPQAAAPQVVAPRMPTPQAPVAPSPAAPSRERPAPLAAPRPGEPQLAPQASMDALVAMAEQLRGAGPAAPGAPPAAPQPAPPAAPQAVPQATMAPSPQAALPPAALPPAALPPAPAPAPAAPAPQAALPAGPAPQPVVPSQPAPGPLALAPAAPQPPAAPPSMPQPPLLQPPAAQPPAAQLPATQAPAAPLPPRAATPGAAMPVTAPIPLPFGRSVGAAALARGGALIIAFDDNRPLELAALRRLSPALARLEIMEVPGAAVLRLPLVPGGGIPGLRRDADGIWQIVPPNGPRPERILVDQEEGASPRLLLRVAEPGRVVAVPDRETGGLLLLGLLGAPARALPVGQSFSPFDLLPTDHGVALAIRDPSVALRTVREGFAVPLASKGTLAIGPIPGHLGEVGSQMARVLDLQDRPVAALLQRRRNLFAQLMNAPPQARAALRLDLAETLLAMGLGAEAQALAQLATEDDPRIAGDKRALLLIGAGALMAGRGEESLAPLADPRLPREGEPAFWQALARLDALGEGTPSTELAAALARNAPLLVTYPKALRDRLVPRVARALLEAGAQRDAAALLDEAPGETPGHVFARARLAEARGETDAAMATYEKLTEGRDRDIRDRARGRIAELGLVSGKLDPGAAAAMLEAAIPGWRGDQRELNRRLRAAELYHQAGQHESALALLEETATLFPDAAESVQGQTAEALLGVLLDPKTPVIEAAQFYEQRQAQLPQGPRLDAAALRIADGLAALDLWDPAARLLAKAALKSDRPAPINLRLAELLVAAGEGEKALSVIQALPEAALEPGDRPRRSMAEARALALSGQLTQATAALRTMGPAGAARLADLLAAQQDWAGAADALSAHAAALVPAAPAPLNPAQRQLLLRLAAFRTLAGDEARIAQLRDSYGSRMAGGPLGDAFATLTTPPASAGTPELQRLRQEVALSRALSKELQSLR